MPMPRIVQRLFSQDEQTDADRQTASLAGLAVTLLLVVIGLFLVRELKAKSLVEDCLLAGRQDCDVVVAVVR
jgi:hypothetical protein